MKIIAAALLALTSLVATSTLAEARDYHRHHGGPVMVVRPSHHGWHHGHDRWHHRSHWNGGHNHHN